MACAIPELIFDKQEPMPKLKRFTGYTGYTGNCSEDEFIRLKREYDAR